MQTGSPNPSRTAMELPFTIDQFYGVFRDYNTSVWPAQWVLVALGLAAVAAALRPRPWSGVAVSAILGVLWSWIAMAYHLAFFARISAPAYAFAALSMVGAAVFLASDASSFVNGHVL